MTGGATAPLSHIPVWYAQVVSVCRLGGECHGLFVVSAMAGTGRGRGSPTLPRGRLMPTMSGFRGVAVITSASHAEGPRFDPGRNHLFALAGQRLDSPPAVSSVHQPVGRPPSATPWRNGSASDSRSEGCVFKSRRGHVGRRHVFSFRQPSVQPRFLCRGCVAIIAIASVAQ